jgi:hypothetical protein
MSENTGNKDACGIDPALVSWAMVAHPEDCPCSSCVANRADYGGGYREAKEAHRAAYRQTVPASALAAWEEVMRHD